MVETTLMIGGEAGQGVQSIGFILTKIFTRSGYYVFSDQDYESRVRGGHNFFRIRVKDSEVGAIHEDLDILLALNQESVDLHRKELSSKGMVIFNQDKVSDIEEDGLIGIPLGKLAQEKAGNPVTANTVALGACLGLLDLDLDIAEELLKEIFGEDSADANLKALNAGNNHIKSTYNKKFSITLPIRTKSNNILINGNEALALGSIAAGCKFISAYPMTPASSIMEYMASHENMGIIVVQAEDEIAAINMAIGAGYTGVRAMTATSGSGFCLMVEGLGLAGLTETPVVIVDAQRPGPAVGLPTRTEQGDLQFVLSAHHGDFPRAVLAPSTVEDAFYLTIKAFNLAEKYQIPVIILTDHTLATSYQTVPYFDFSKITIDRGELFDATGGIKPSDYKRHAETSSGISPRAFPGLSEALVVTDSDEHGEDGHMIEDSKIRSRQVEKRLRKYHSLEKEIEAPLTYGATKPEITLVGWGSTRGAVQEAVDMLNNTGTPTNMLHLNELWPFPGKSVKYILKKSRKSYVIEGNASGQLARLIRTETGITVDGKVLKYDGRPFTPAEIYRRIKKGEVTQ